MLLGWRMQCCGSRNCHQLRAEHLPYGWHHKSSIGEYILTICGTLFLSSLLEPQSHQVLPHIVKSSANYKIRRLCPALPRSPPLHQSPPRPLRQELSRLQVHPPLNLRPRVSYRRSCLQQQASPHPILHPCLRLPASLINLVRVHLLHPRQRQRHITQVLTMWQGWVREYWAVWRQQWPCCDVQPFRDCVHWLCLLGWGWDQAKPSI